MVKDIETGESYGRMLLLTLDALYGHERAVEHPAIDKPTEKDDFW